MKKRWFALVLAAALALTASTGCGIKKTDPDPIGKTDSGKVRYLNREPSQAEYWQGLSRRYTEETGVPVTITTAEDEQYLHALDETMDGEDAPSLIQLSGPTELREWGDSCYDLSDSSVYRQLVSDSFALRDEDGVVRGVAYAVKTYGIVCNRALLQRAGYAQSSITDFTSLKAVADDLQARREELGIKGAFAADAETLPIDLANVALFYEYKEDDDTRADSIKGTYLENFKQFVDLCLADSTSPAQEYSSATSSSAAASFVNNEAVFCVSETGLYSKVMQLDDSNLGLLPVYLGISGEQDQGFCTGAELYWCVNKESSEEDIQATLDFLHWVVTSAEGTTRLADSMGLVCPYRTAEKPSNPLDELARQSVAGGKNPVGWCFSSMPSENWKNTLRSALGAYAAGGSWESVHAAFVDNWASEVKLAAND